MTDDLHPQVQALLAGILKPQDPALPLTVAEFRAANDLTSALLGGPGEVVAQTWETSASTSHGSVKLRWYQPTGVRPHHLLLYVHGGGWVAGTLDAYDTLCRALSRRTDFCIASVEYSLSPETIYPQALYQVLDVLRNARSLASASGLEIRKLAAAGDSAGAALIASAFHQLSVLGEPLPDAAVLVYPVTDAALSSPSYERFGTGFNLTTERMRWFWQQYLGMDLDQAGDLLLHPTVSPVYSTRLHAFPPTLVLTAACDPLRDEGEALAQRLQHAGCRVEYLNIPGQIHGFLRFRQALTDASTGPDAIMLRISRFLATIT